jgi:hypothetical protein
VSPSHFESKKPLGHAGRFFMAADQGRLSLRLPLAFSETANQQVLNFVRVEQL